MTIKKDLEKTLLTAMREKDNIRKNALRMALSSIKLAEIEAGKELDDPSIFNIMQKEIRTREETIEEAEKANRPDMIAPLKAEIAILKEYLPKELSDDELNVLAKKAISDLNASTPKKMGLVMKSIIQDVQGKASNDRISKVVRGLLDTKL
jgi:uncharacterized protein YqeY